MSLKFFPKASSVTGSFAAQFAKAAGMRVIAVADHSRHGQRLMTIGVGESVLPS
jgi:NADPH:quinone reductase-like Zn-dependent oxidoreductase